MQMLEVMVMTFGLAMIGFGLKFTLSGTMAQEQSGGIYLLSMGVVLVSTCAIGIAMG